MHKFEKISDLINLKKNQNAIAIIDRTGPEKQNITYREFCERVASARGELVNTHGVKAGDHVVILGSNSVAFLSAYFATMSLGAIAAPINPNFEKNVLQTILSDLEPRLVLADHGLGELTTTTFPLSEIDKGDHKIKNEADFSSNNLALILYTSGSTGVPKGVQLSHRSLVSSLTDMASEIALLEGSRVIVSAPLFHMGALNYVHMWFTAHGAISLLPRFEADAFLDTVEQDDIAVIGGVPPMIPRLASAARKTSKGPFPNVAAVAIGSAPLTENIIADSQMLFPNAIILNNYGTTEIGPSVFGGHPDNLPRPQMSIGFPRDPSSIRLRDGANKDEGVLEVKAESLMKGYLNKDEETRSKIKDGWYRTGDLMRRDENGFFFCVGREDDMFVCNGENVYPIECETLLQSHPDIVEAAIVPAPDDKSGEAPIAFVVAAQNAQLDEEAVKNFARENGPAFRYPRRVYIIDSLPMNAVNKVDKAALKQRARAAHM
ncbi:MAG: class I adenylate-forming enzyme family protein [Pseudomonadota bacterium]